MVRRWCAWVLLLSAALVALLPLAARPARADGLTQATAPYALVVYSQPDRSSPIVGVLGPRAVVVLEARTVDATWILGHSADGGIRGWMMTRHLTLLVGTSVPGLLVSNESALVPSEVAAASGPISLAAYPAVPTTLGRAHEIYELGRVRGTDLHVISKVGDCLTDNPNFLTPIGRGEYNLGQYAYLQDVIHQFSLSMSYDSLAAYDGLVTTAVLDPTFADPMACLPGESPLQCEYRVRNPSVAIIMFGAQDLLFTSAEDFDTSLRRIVHETVQAGIIPILSTFPAHSNLPDTSRQFNEIVVRVALEYDVPLINLWLALEPLTDHALKDGRHLSDPLTTAGDFSPQNLQRGFPLRNLLTLQALDAVWRGAMG